MPIFRNLGVKVIEEEPYTLTRADGVSAGIYDLSLRVDDASSGSRARTRSCVSSSSLR